MFLVITFVAQNCAISSSKVRTVKETDIRESLSKCETKVRMLRLISADECVILLTCNTEQAVQAVALTVDAAPPYTLLRCSDSNVWHTVTNSFLKSVTTKWNNSSTLTYSKESAAHPRQHKNLYTKCGVNLTWFPDTRLFEKIYLGTALLLIVTHFHGERVKIIFPEIKNKRFFVTAILYL